MFKKGKKLKEAGASQQAYMPNAEAKVSTVPQNIPQELQAFAAITPVDSGPVQCVTFKDPTFRYTTELSENVIINTQQYKPFIDSSDPTCLKGYVQEDLLDYIMQYGLNASASDNDKAHEFDELKEADLNVAKKYCEAKRDTMVNCYLRRYENSINHILVHAAKIVFDKLFTLIDVNLFSEDAINMAYNKAWSYSFIDDSAFYQVKLNELEMAGAKAVRDNDQNALNSIASTFDLISKNYILKAIDNLGNYYSRTMSSVRDLLYKNYKINVVNADAVYRELEAFASEVFYQHGSIIINNVFTISDALPIVQQSYYPENISDGRGHKTYYDEF